MNAGENRGRRDSVWNTLRPGRSSRVVAYAYRNPTTVAEPVESSIIIRLLRMAAIQRALWGTAR